MSKLMLTLFGALWVGGCGLPPAILPLPIPVDLSEDDDLLVDVDGGWRLSDIAGRQACFVIQDSRVSILDVQCGFGEDGLVARITEAPPVTGGLSVIVVTATYNRHTFEEAQYRLTFAGQRQPDGTFTGTRRDELLDDPEAAEETAAVLQQTSLPR